jgi:hypothetical protein
LIQNTIKNATVMLACNVPVVSATGFFGFNMRRRSKNSDCQKTGRFSSGLREGCRTRAFQADVSRVNAAYPMRRLARDMLYGASGAMI